MKHLLLTVYFIGCIGFLLHAQLNVKDSAVYAPLASIFYGAQLPGGDLAERFGWSSSLGGSFIFKTRKNWLIGYEGHFLFGDQVKENHVLDNMAIRGEEEERLLIDRDGRLSLVLFHQRGQMHFAKAGKIFNWFGGNPNSGIFIMGGVGYMQHKIRMFTKEEVPQLTNDYKKGYDRFTNGLAFSEMIGYYFFSNSRLVNFFAGFELMQGFTQNRRSFNFDTRETDDRERLDLLYGIKVGWTFPMYKRIPQEYYLH